MFNIEKRWTQDQLVYKVRWSFLYTSQNKDKKKERGSCDPLSGVNYLPTVITGYNFVVDSLNIFKESGSVVHRQHGEVEHLLRISSR